MQAARGTPIAARKGSPSTRSGAVWAIVATVALIGYGLDLGTKTWALTQLDPANPPVLLGGQVILRLIRNPGAAFSMGESLTVLLTVVAAAALVGVLFWLVPRIRHRGWAVGAGLLLAGIAGNLTDRLFREPGFGHGHVIDFIQVPWFAIFNVADICITFAAIVLIWLMVIRQVNPDGSRVTSGTAPATEASDEPDAASGDAGSPEPHAS